MTMHAILINGGVGFIAIGLCSAIIVLVVVNTCITTITDAVDRLAFSTFLFGLALAILGGILTILSFVLPWL